MLSVAAPVVAFLYLLYTLISTIRVLYYHPLSRIPGPSLWIAFPLFRHLSSIRGRHVIDLRALHQKYGEAVRFGPNEVSFITAQAWRDIYGHGHKQLPKVVRSTQSRRDIISANDIDHSRYRRSISHGFSAKALQEQEPLMKGYIDKLIIKLKEHAESRSPVDMVKWYNVTTFDLIGDLAFGQSFGGLETSGYHFWVSTLFDSVRVLSYIALMDTYPMLFQLVKPFMPTGLAGVKERQDEYTISTVQKRLTKPKNSGSTDFMDSMLRNYGEIEGLSDEELAENASVLVIAGSETTATLLSGVTFLLLKNPVAMEKLKDEVLSVIKSEEDITFTNISANLPYMLACLDEALRCYPPVPTGIQRYTVAPTTVISGYEVPQNTKVAVHQSSAYHSSMNFYKPECFIPERWLPEAKNDPKSPFFNDNRDVFQPFSTGPRNCVGKNLAYNEMRIILTRIIWNFDLELCPESQAWDKQKSYILWDKPQLMCKLTPMAH
ncbi:hypothetical protein BOTCAL_0747g00020 [Botryotinia calthae]|uniref:Cytochrome P450 monooxygenase n=1 Tax=Botryotinia calthae TaxID=38488 RepID=A0A4Y8CGI6_9HELO|nr:hypothetical protein BOTCAL_0747g00020 [Botryotinia calthae]